MTNYKLSRFGKKITEKSGILELMEDLGRALKSASGDISMLGGGNPAHIPEAEEIFHKTIREIMANTSDLSSIFGDYDPPGGNAEFIRNLVDLLNTESGFNITPDNVAVTSGSQTAFFLLFNLLAGEHEDGFRHVLFPMVPEYIGYADQGIFPDQFVSCRPLIHEMEGPFFKYNIDFDNLKITDKTAAICVSRPTNPSGNVLTDTEIDRLLELGRENNIPLIIDNAYGNPFPQLIFTEASFSWKPGMVLVFSLSKMGLPGLRTGIVVGDPELIAALTSANAVLSLSNNNLGQAIASKLISNRQITRLSRDIIKPWYKQLSEQAIKLIQEEWQGINYKIHKSEGALFLWIWFPDLPVSTMELYRILKTENVIIVPGEYFYPGFDDDWEHTRQCIRINFAHPSMAKGIKNIGKSLKKLYKK